mgnify:CR=1 FL=1
MAKKKMSLKARTKRAETLQAVAWKRMKEKEAQSREATLQSRGAQIWVSLLLARLGNHIVVTQEEIELAKGLEFVAARKDNGDLELFLVGDEMEPDNPDSE